MPRPLRIQQEEYPYHVITRTNGRAFKFGRPTYKIFIRILNEATKKFDAAIEHFQLMSNHYHMKLRTPHANISQIMHFINGRLAQAYNHRFGTTGHLWERRFHSSIIETDAYAQRVVIYLYGNPVRAGLCKRPGESEHISSFEFYARGKPIPFTVVADEVYLALGATEAERRARFLELVHEGLDLPVTESLRQLLRGFFVGSADFIQRMRQQYATHLRLA